MRQTEKIARVPRVSFYVKLEQNWNKLEHDVTAAQPRTDLKEMYENI